MSISIDCKDMCVAYAGDAYNMALSMIDLCIEALDPESGTDPKTSNNISETMMLVLSMLESLKDRIDFNELPGSTDRAINEREGSHPLI